MEGDGDLGLGHHGVPAYQLDGHVAAERGRLRIEEVLLAGARRELHRGAEPRPGVHATADPELSRDGRSRVLDIDRDGEPGPGAHVTLEQGAGRHGEPVSRDGDRRGGQQRQQGQEGRRKAGDHADGTGLAAQRHSGSSASNGGRSEHRRTDRRKSCTAGRPLVVAVAGRFVVAVRPRLSYDAGAPEPIVLPRASRGSTCDHGRARHPRPRGTRARHQTVSRAPLRRRGRRGPDRARCASI